MKERTYLKELKRIEQILSLEHCNDIPYWEAYHRGLRRAHFVAANTTTLESQQIHDALMQSSPGYRHGFIAYSTATKIGRPSKGGHALPGVTVTREILDGLKQIAKRTDRSLPEVRRTAYAAYLEQGKLQRE